jgi:HSP20 family molecular chaperone IbpA
MPIETWFDRLFRSLSDEDDLDAGYMSQQIPQAWRQQLSYRSSYEVHRDENQVQVDVDVPGVASKDLKVEVLNTPACVVQWSGSRKLLRTNNKGEEEAAATTTFANRLRLGSSVECEKLAANMSHGVLRLTAPLKERGESLGPRTIPVTERDD